MMTLTQYIQKLKKDRDNYQNDKQTYLKLLELQQYHYTANADEKKKEFQSTIEYLEGKEILLSMIIQQLHFIKTI